MPARIHPSIIVTDTDFLNDIANVLQLQKPRININITAVSVSLALKLLIEMLRWNKDPDELLLVQVGFRVILVNKKIKKNKKKIIKKCYLK